MTAIPQLVLTVRVAPGKVQFTARADLIDSVATATGETPAAAIELLIRRLNEKFPAGWNIVDVPDVAALVHQLASERELSRAGPTRTIGPP